MGFETANPNTQTQKTSVEMKIKINNIVAPAHNLDRHHLPKFIIAYGSL
jgi:hypothetical protein